MRIWLITLLYRSLSPLDQYEVHKRIACPTIDVLLAESFDTLDRAFERREKRFPQSKVQSDGK